MFGGTLRTQELRSSLGQEHSGFCLHPRVDLVPCLSKPKCPEKNWSPRRLTHCRRDIAQSETARTDNTRDNMMEKGKGKNTSNRKQGYLAHSHPSTPTTVRPGYIKTPEKQDSDLKSHLIMVMEDFKKDINNSL